MPYKCIFIKSRSGSQVGDIVLCSYCQVYTILNKMLNIIIFIFNLYILLTTIINALKKEVLISNKTKNKTHRSERTLVFLMFQSLIVMTCRYMKRSQECLRSRGKHLCSSEHRASADEHSNRGSSRQIHHGLVPSFLVSSKYL